MRPRAQRTGAAGHLAQRPPSSSALTAGESAMLGAGADAARAATDAPRAPLTRRGARSEAAGMSVLAAVAAGWAPEGAGGLRPLPLAETGRASAADLGVDARGGTRREREAWGRKGGVGGRAIYQKATKTRTCRASTSRLSYHSISHRARPHQTDSVPCLRPGTMARSLLHACHAANDCRSLAQESGLPSLSPALGARGPRCRCPSRCPQQQHRATVRRRGRILRRESSLRGRTCGLWVNGLVGRRRLKAARGGVGRARVGG